MWNILGATLLVLDIKMELLQVCGPLLMEIILQFPLGLSKLQGLVIYVDDHFLHQNVMPPLFTGLHNGIHLFFISGIPMDCA